MHALDGFSKSWSGGVVAIGNFDGVHLGHQAVLQTALKVGRTHSAPVFAMTFEPHPRTLFAPDAPVFRLTPEPAKAILMSALGLDGVLTIPFDRPFSSLSANAFVDDILVDRLGIKHAVTGYDFHFGRKRTGTPQFLQQAGRERGFGVSVVDAFAGDGRQPISSSRVRAALRLGAVAQAPELLGYRWFVTSRVRHGEKRGRQLNFPTANLALADNCQLLHGIYAVRAHVNGATHDGVASFGRRPTFDNGAPLLEIFVFDFDADIYDRRTGVTFVDMLRPEQKFDTVDALVEQMKRDCVAARAALAAAQTGTALDAALTQRLLEYSRGGAD
jgi:riboflavin kinase/FMN adenylyltransferase